MVLAMSDIGGNNMNSAAAEITQGPADGFLAVLDRRGRIQIVNAIFSYRLPCLGKNLWQVYPSQAEDSKQPMTNGAKFV